jgi:hypothetical protein
MIINSRYHNLREFSNKFKDASPFPFVVLDDFLNIEYFSQLVSELEFPQDDVGGKIFSTNFESDKWISKNAGLPQILLGLIEGLNAKEWIDNLKSLTGLPAILPSVCGNTSLANYHVMQSNGFLAPHVDHGQEPETGMPHVLNIIIYLSPKWDPKNGGATLLYDLNGKKIEAKVEYRPNRAIIFLHTPYSFHCVEQIKNNPSYPRRTLYVDYYSNSRDPYANFDLKFPNIWFKHPTTFMLPKKTDYFSLKNYSYIRNYIEYSLRKMMKNITTLN